MANAVERFRLYTLRGALKLEVAGMRRSRSPSARAIVCSMLGLPASTRASAALAALQERLDTLVNDPDAIVARE